MTLTQLFDLSLQGRRESVALEFLGRSYTFGEIDERSDAMAALLRELGLEAGDRLCVYLVNCLEMIDLYLACVKLRVIFVPVNILYREREIAHIVGDADPKAIVTAEQIPRISATQWLLSELQPPASAERPVVMELDGDAPAAIIYTSLRAQPINLVVSASYGRP